MRRFLGVMGLLCFFFGGYGQGLVVGDRVPVGVLGAGVRGRLVLLDFWATWCAPCRAMVPRLDSLQRVFGERILVLPVAYESAAVVRPVEAAMRRVHDFRFEREVVGDTVLGRLFPHRVLPHYVWVSGDGVVLAVTENKEVTAANVRKLLAGGGNGLTEKRDARVGYDKALPLFWQGNGGDGSGLRYQSVLSAYVPGLPGGLEISALDSVQGQRFGVRNVPLLWLYRLAFGDRGRHFPGSRVRLSVREPGRLNSLLSGQAYADWLSAGNGWCYELWLPPGLAKGAFGWIRSDVARLFPQYRASVDTERVRSLVLVRTDSLRRWATSGGANVVAVGPYSAHLQNATLGALLLRLEGQFMQGSALPISDGTGLRERVDLELSAPLADVKQLNAALALYGLALREMDWPAELLVIRDSY